MLPIVTLSVVLSGLLLYSSELAAAPSNTPFDLDQLGLTLAAVGLPLTNAFRRRVGRPRKFDAPSRAMTLTLPESTIQTLSELDSDLSRAVVRLATEQVPATARPAAEVAVFGRRAVISVRPTASLERRLGIELVPLPDGRALISFNQPETIAEVELLLKDALEDAALVDGDRAVVEGIAAILSAARKSNDLSLLKRSIIVIESIRKTKKPASRRAR